MAIPKIFVSSTCYDLKYIRENLKYFIINMGYEPVLSDDGDVYYDVNIHTHDACLTEVSNCQLFVLIIGGRYGGRYKGSDKSITNMEYSEAVKLKIPIFTLIESDVLNQHHLFIKNKDNNTINYTAVDNTKIFEFLDEVRRNVFNNAMYPFRNFTDIEKYLKKQWAGMMYKFLTTDSETKRVGDLFEQIQSVTNKIEMYTKVVAERVADNDTNRVLRVYNEMKDLTRKPKIFHLAFFQLDISVKPEEIIMFESFSDFLSHKSLVMEQCNDFKDRIEDEIITLSTGSGEITLNYDEFSEMYNIIRENLKIVMRENNITTTQILSVIE